MSFMQVCWSLMRYPRSKGVPYIMENGTFDQALVFMLRLFGIMLGLSVVENGIHISYHACNCVRYDYIDFRLCFCLVFPKRALVDIGPFLCESH